MKTIAMRSNQSTYGLVAGRWIDHSSEEEMIPSSSLEEDLARYAEYQSGAAARKAAADRSYAVRQAQAAVAAAVCGVGSTWSTNDADGVDYPAEVVAAIGRLAARTGVPVVAPHNEAHDQALAIAAITGRTVEKSASNVVAALDAIAAAA